MGYIKSFFCDVLLRSWNIITEDEELVEKSKELVLNSLANNEETVAFFKEKVVVPVLERFLMSDEFVKAFFGPIREIERRRRCFVCLICGMVAVSEGLFIAVLHRKLKSRNKFEPKKTSNQKPMKKFKMTSNRFVGPGYVLGLHDVVTLLEGDMVAEKRRIVQAQRRATSRWTSEFSS